MMEGRNTVDKLESQLLSVRGLHAVVHSFFLVRAGVALCVGLRVREAPVTGVGAAIVRLIQHALAIGSRTLQLIIVYLLADICVGGFSLGL